MNRELLEEILKQLTLKKMLVVGDFFLDKYLVIDPSLDELSIETGLTAYQVIDRRLYPGAAGTVTNNLIALGLGEVIAVGAVGDDGEGVELIRGLQDSGVITSHLVVMAGRVTPTYTKPVVADPAGERELNRLDIQNRTPTPEETETKIIETLRLLAPSVDAIAVLDQVEEENHGVITDRVRETLAEIGREYPSLPILCDSRAHIGKFRNVMIKPNRSEAVAAWRKDGGASADTVQPTDPADELVAAAQTLRGLTERAVFVTDGPNGQYVLGEEGLIHRRGFPVRGPVDPVGAGDSTTAGILSALCCGASLSYAAFFGNLVASVTVQKIGTTGTASPDELRNRWQEVEKMTV